MSSDPEVLELGNYRVLRKDDGSLWMLGRGGYGTTYKAEHKHLGRICALKVINDDLMKNNDARRRFLKEAQAAALLDHAHIASIYDFGESDGVFYYAMSYCAGGDLSEFSVAKGPQPWSVVRELGRQILEALVTAHGKGLLHRDLKPSNIMLAGADGPPDLQLIDFGLVKMLEHHQADSTNMMLTQDGSFMGNPLTASPEQLREEDLDERSDLFSLGITLWYLLCGESPFGGISTAELVHQRLGSEGYDAALPADLNVEGRAILGMLLSKNKADRFGHAHEVLEALAGNIEEANVASAVPSAPISAPLETSDVAPTCDWDEVWEIQEQLKKFTYGTYYSCVGKTHGVTGATLFIPDVESPYLDSVVRHADKMVKSGTHVLTSFFQKGEYTDAAAYLCQPFSRGNFKTFLHAVGNLDLQKHLSIFQQIASAVDESIRFDVPGVELDMSDILLDLRMEHGQAPQTEDDWVNFFTEKEQAGEEYVKRLEVSTLPKLVRSADIEEAMVTVGSDDLAANPIARLGGFLYRAITGMSVKQTAYLSPEAHVASSSISEESNRFLSEVISARECPESAMEMLKELCNFEAGDWRTSELEATLSSMDRKRHEISRTHSSMLSMIGSNPAHSVSTSRPVVTPPLQPAAPASSASVSELGKAPAEPLPAQEPASISTHTPLRDTRRPPAVASEKSNGKGSKTILIIASIAALLLILLGGGLTWWFGFRGGDEPKSSHTTATEEQEPVEVIPDAVTLSFDDITLGKGAPTGAEVYSLKNKNDEQLASFSASDDKIVIGNLPSNLFETSNLWPLKLELAADGYTMPPISITQGDFEAGDDGQKRYTKKLRLQPLVFTELAPFIHFDGKDVPISAGTFKGYLYPMNTLLEWKLGVKDGKIHVALPEDEKFPVKSLLSIPGMTELQFNLEQGKQPKLNIEIAKRKIQLGGVGSFSSMKFVPDFSKMAEGEIKNILKQSVAEYVISSESFDRGRGSWFLPPLNGRVHVTTSTGMWSFNIGSAAKFIVLTEADRTGAVAEKSSPEFTKKLKLAMEGIADSQYEVGVAYLSGKGVPKSGLASTEWFYMAAMQGDPGSLHNMGVAYASGTGVIKNDREALKWFAKGAKAGYAESQVEMGFFYHDGRIIKQSYQEAKKFYDLAAAQENARAMFSLGLLYSDKKSGFFDIGKTLEAYGESAKRGYAPAMFNLGLYYENDQNGVSMDLEKAKTYFKDAAAKGYPKAKEKLMNLGG